MTMLAYSQTEVYFRFCGTGTTSIHTSGSLTTTRFPSCSFTTGFVSVLIAGVIDDEDSSVFTSSFILVYNILGMTILFNIEIMVKKNIICLFEGCRQKV